MRLYSCKVRLGGSLYNEVPKFDVTAPEVHILRIIHGSDAIANLEETGKNKVGQAEERDRLIEIYGLGLANLRQQREMPEQAFAGVFGIGARLPDDIPGTPKAVAKTAAKPAPEPEADEEPVEPDPEE